MEVLKIARPCPGTGLGNRIAAQTFKLCTWKLYYSLLEKATSEENRYSVICIQCRPVADDVANLMFQLQPVQKARNKLSKHTKPGICTKFNWKKTMVVPKRAASCIQVSRKKVIQTDCPTQFN